MRGYISLMITVIVLFGILIGIARCEDWDAEIENCDNLPLPEQKPLCLSTVNALRGAEKGQAESTRDVPATVGAAPTTSPVADSLPAPDISEPSEPSETQLVRDVSEVSEPLLDLQILSVFEKKNPRRLVVTVTNSSDQTVYLKTPFRLELQRDGELLVYTNFYSTARSARFYRQSEVTFVLTPKRLFPKIDFREVRFAVAFQYFYGKKTGYRKGDTLILKHGDRVISEYSETVSAAPRLQRKVATLWAGMK